MQRILIKNGTVVTDGKKFQSDVLVENGKIVKMANSITESADKVIDASGCYIMAGFIDTHTHFDLPLATCSTADDFETGTKAAVAGGTTTVLDFATQDRGMTMQDAFDVWMKKAEKSSCNYGFHLAVSEWNEERIAEIDKMIEQGVTSFKMYMVYDAMRVDDGQMYDAMKRAADRDCVIGIHCENYYLLREKIAEVKNKGIMGPEGHPLSRPNIVEAEAVGRLMRIAELGNCPAWVVHLSTKESLDEVRAARARGQEVYVETCPQYVALTDDCYKQQDAYKFIMSPPLRKKADNEAILKAMGNDEVDFTGTDHCSFTMEQKLAGGAKDDFTKVPNGGAGEQNRAQIFHTFGVLGGYMSIEQLAEQLSGNAAKVFGMYPKKGVIREGSDADIVVFDPKKEQTISYKTNLHNCDNSPFEGIKTTGLTRDVILNGEVVVEQFELVQPGKGQYVFRGPSLRPNKQK